MVLAAHRQLRQSSSISCFSKLDGHGLIHSCCRSVGVQLVASCHSSIGVPQLLHQSVRCIAARVVN